MWIRFENMKLTSGHAWTWCCYQNVAKQIEERFEKITRWEVGGALSKCVPGGRMTVLPPYLASIYRYDWKEDHNKQRNERDSVWTFLFPPFFKNKNPQNDQHQPSKPAERSGASGRKSSKSMKSKRWDWKKWILLALNGKWSAVHTGLCGELS